jgi:hypothetical protein
MSSHNPQARSSACRAPSGPHGFGEYVALHGIRALAKKEGNTSEASFQKSYENVTFGSSAARLDEAGRSGARSTRFSYAHGPTKSYIYVERYLLTNISVGHSARPPVPIRGGSAGFSSAI